MLVPKDNDRLPSWIKLKSVAKDVLDLTGRALTAAFILIVGLIVIPASLLIVAVAEAPLHSILLVYLCYLLYAR